MNLLQKITDRFSKVKPLPEGLHHLQTAADEKPYRLHLRLREDGSGVLVLNASTVLQLNPTAAEYAYHFVKGTDPDEAAQQVATRYRVDKKTALQDYADFADRIKTLIHTPDLDPVSFLDFERAAPHSADLPSPLRLDCALTYKLPANSKAEYAPTKRVDRELTAEEWQTILDKAWRVGIPHVIFTGGEATLRDDLPALIAHAEHNGQVCGLLTDGVKLADKEYLDALLQSGLDHVMVIFQPDNPQTWKAIEAIIPCDLFITVHFTVNRETIKDAEKHLEKLAQLGAQNLSLSASEDGMKDELNALQNAASNLGFSLRWDLPVPYSASNPVAMEIEDEEIPPGAGRAWMYVEPDGDVLPAQGEADKILGNFLRDDWEKMFKR